jgi:hypothetical protein
MQAASPRFKASGVVALRFESSLKGPARPSGQLLTLNWIFSSSRCTPLLA